MKGSVAEGKLQIIPDCYIQFPSAVANLLPDARLYFRILPKVSDQRSVNYNDESIMGRSFPLKTFANGSNRSIGIEASFIILDEFNDPPRIWNEVKALQACTYPQDTSEASSAPFSPPFVCKLKCGNMLGRDGVCAVMRSYSVNWPTEVAWHWDGTTGIKLPMYFTVSTQWEVVYQTSKLPGSNRILNDGA